MSDDFQVLATGDFSRFVRRNGWEYMERINVSGIVLIVPVTNDDQVVLVEQFRIPLGKKVIEWPAGLAGDVPGSEDEPLLEAARRELLEETGFQAGEMTRLTEGPPSPALNDEILCFYRAEKLTRVTEGGGDETEDIRVHVTPRAGVHQWLLEKQAQGLLVDPKVYAGLYFLNR